MDISVRMKTFFWDCCFMGEVKLYRLIKKKGHEMLMTFSYKEESWVGIEPEELVWPAGLGLVTEPLLVNLSSSQGDPGVPNSLLKHTIHPRRAQLLGTQHSLRVCGMRDHQG